MTYRNKWANFSSNMPILNSKYQGPPFYLFNKHLETIVPSIFRKIEGVTYEREQIDTPDNDFLNLDWIKGGNDRLLVISHGLEGGSDRHYVTALAKLFSQDGWDILAWNNRSCNGEMNRAKILYHHAASYDLRSAVDHAVAKRRYQRICLTGISMGGGQTLRYLGEHEKHPIPDIVDQAVVVSTPCSLVESAEVLNERSNRIYEKRFLQKLKVKIKAKAQQYPEIDVTGIDEIDKLREMDDRFSGPLHGFKDGKEFYEFCDPYPFISKIKHKILILNALNDPMLVGRCFPRDLAEQMDNLYLEITKRGGHVGFALPNSEYSYSELRTFEFLNQVQLL